MVLETSGGRPHARLLALVFIYGFGMNLCITAALSYYYGFNYFNIEFCSLGTVLRNYMRVECSGP